METLKRVDQNSVADYRMATLENNLYKLQELVVSGEIIDKFLDSEMTYPIIPNKFKSHAEYQNKWLHLLQYEMFCKLLSRTSNKS